jgi:hypothetical protein
MMSSTVNKTQDEQAILHCPIRNAAKWIHLVSLRACVNIQNGQYAYASSFTSLMSKCKQSALQQQRTSKSLCL